MKIFAAIDNNGRAWYTIQPSDSNFHTDGEAVPGRDLVLRETPAGINPVVLMRDYYFEAGWQQRKANLATLTNTTLSSLPVPCTIQINEQEYACNESTAEIELVYQGTYIITVKAHRYFDKTFEVTV